MRSGIILAWLIGEGIIVWRSVSKEHRPPMPGALLASSGFFALLAVLAEYEPARAVATITAFGLDIAAYVGAPGFGTGKLANPYPTPTGKNTTAPIGEANPG